MCHVFRCELPARHIANTLCEICKKVIAQRAAAAQAANGQRARPSDLPNLHPVGRGTGDNTITFDNLLKSESFDELLLTIYLLLNLTDNYFSFITDFCI